MRQAVFGRNAPGLVLGTAANDSCPRRSLRACRTTLCPCSTSSCAAIRPSPSEEPVMNTRATIADLSA
jgi:hypothetical protein